MGVTVKSIVANPVVHFFALSGVLALGVMLLLSGRDRQAEPEPSAPILLLCDAGLRMPIEAIIDAFQRRGGTRVEVHDNASNRLTETLADTGRGDVLLTGDAHSIAEAARAGWVVDSLPVAALVPVIHVAAGNPGNITSVEDLAQADLRLALADEQAGAIGRITAEVLRLNGVNRETIRKQTIVTATCASELGRAVGLGRVDAAIVWLPVAKQYPLTGIVPIPETKNQRSPVVAATLATTVNPVAAAAFLRFLDGSSARAIFERHHYTILPQTP